VVRPQCLLYNCQRLLIQQLYLIVASLGIVKVGEVVEASGGVRMARTKRLSANVECLQKSLFCLAIESSCLVKLPQSIPGVSNIEMPGTKCITLNAEGSSQEAPPTGSAIA